MAEVKLMKINPSTGASQEHSSAADDLTMHNGSFGGSLASAGDFSVATDKFTVASASGNSAVAGTFDAAGDFKINTDKFVVAAVTGNTTVAGELASAGDFSVATDKFSVAAATGNAIVAGELDAAGDFKVNVNKFVVAAASGNTDIAGELAAAGDLSIATNKFNVAAASGDTDIAGDLDVASDLKVNVNKFVVTAASGNTSIAGTIGVTGAATFSSTASFGGDVTLAGNKITSIADGTVSSDGINKGQLDSAVSALTAGTNWKDHINYLTSIAITTGVSTAQNVQDAAETEGTYDFAADEYVLCINDSKIYKIGAGALKTDRILTEVTVAGDGDRHVAVAQGDARYCQIDLPDSPAGQENSAVYIYNGSSYVKLTDFDWQLASGIDLAGAYSHDKAEAGIPASGDSIQLALEKLGGNSLKLINDLSIGAASQGAHMVAIQDAGGLIAASTVEDALVENRGAIDSIEDNTIASANGSIAVSGTVGADDQNVDVVFSVAGLANRAIEASALIDHSLASQGAKLVGFEYAAAANWDADNTTANAALDELASRTKVLEDSDVTETLQEAYVAGNIITTSAAEGNLQFAGDQVLDVDITSDFSGNMALSSGANLAASAGSLLSGFDSIEGILSANLLDKSAAETISGNWSFSNDVVIGSGPTDLATLMAPLKMVSTDSSFATSYLKPQAANTNYYSTPDAGASADYVMSEGAATINGAKAYSDINLNSLFKINSVATSANVSSSNLGTLTAGSTSNADALHTHAGSALDVTAGAGGVSAHDAVRISANDTVLPAQADALANAYVIGFAESAIAASASGQISLAGAIVEGALSGATAGTKYFLSPSVAGGITTTVPSGSGEVILPIGFAMNATDLFVQLGTPQVRA